MATYQVDDLKTKDRSEGSDTDPILAGSTAGLTVILTTPREIVRVRLDRDEVYALVGQALRFPQNRRTPKPTTARRANGGKP